MIALGLPKKILFIIFSNYLINSRGYVCHNDTLKDVDAIECDPGFFFDVEFQKCYDCFSANCKVSI